MALSATIEPILVCYDCCNVVDHCGCKNGPKRVIEVDVGKD